ncbi:glycosyltransferase family 4 protein [Pelagibacterium lacus]|uniref:Glycosyltransferase family 1 protein n=1 Tax=Pelagibacterium lacus TaxID=2282655 RepID=A0A369WA75_9HYPH|nr:glycosyltransferase family 4 protein [Pelagibacterium lacus]RDE08961.1 glycosyltransferase family 1 protein [Pelagibacterium lacus]
MRAPVGGLFRHVADLTVELARRGHAIGIVADSGSGDAATQDRLDSLATHASLGIHRLPIPRLLGMSDATTPLKIRRLARELDVSILHGHGAKGGFCARMARLGKSDPKALYTPHGGALHFDPRSLQGRLFMQIERLLLPASDAVVFESAYAKDVFADKVAVPRCPAPVIHNGLAPAEFEPVIPTDDAADFVYVGELRMLKGIDLLVEALAPLAAADGRPATLVMAGDGPDRNGLTARIEALGLSGRVTLAGVQPARQMFARGRCVVVPSRAESLPYIVLEAAAAGRPVIATRVGGIPEIFGPTADDLIASDEVEALRTAMADWLSDPSRHEAAAVRRLAFIRDRFSLRTMADQVESLYRQLAQ